MTMCCDDYVSHSPALIQWLVVIVLHPDCFYEFSYTLDVSIGVVRCPSASGIDNQYRIG